MALALREAETFTVDIEFETICLEFALDVDTSKMLSEHYSHTDYLDGSIYLRPSKTTGDKFLIVPSQDAGPFHVLLPALRKKIEAEYDSDFETIARMGQVSARLTEHYRSVLAGGNGSLSARELSTLSKAVVCESHFGRLCVYRYRDEFLLEVEHFRHPSSNTYVEVVEQTALCDAVDLMLQRFQDFMGKTLAA